MESDGELAIMALVRAIAFARSAETPIIQSPARESRCNGAVERAVRTWRNQVVSMKDFLQTQIKAELGADSVVLAWLINYAAEVMNHDKIQHNGRTAYEMVTCHKFRR